DVVENIVNEGAVYNELTRVINELIDSNSDVLVDNGNGTFTHTAADGTEVTFDANTTALVDNGDGTYTLTNADGTTLTINTNAIASGYDNSGSGLAAENVQDAIDELVDSLQVAAAEEPWQIEA